MPAEDPYETLGVPSSASDEEVRAAYRAKAREHHPDLRRDDPTAPEAFREVQEAYEEIRWQRERSRTLKDRPGSSRARPPSRAPTARPNEDPSFDRVFETKRQEARYGRSPYKQGKTRNRGSTMQVPFEAAILGGEHRLEVRHGDRDRPKRLRIQLPAGVCEDDRFRIEGRAVRARIEPHPHLRREGDDVILELPVTLAELALGAKLRVPTVSGLVEVALAPGLKSGQRVRLQGKGVPGRGDQFCIVVVVPPRVDRPEIKEALAALAEAEIRSPRPWDGEEGRAAPERAGLDVDNPRD